MHQRCAIICPGRGFRFRVGERCAQRSINAFQLCVGRDMQCARFDRYRCAQAAEDGETRQPSGAFSDTDSESWSPKTGCRRARFGHDHSPPQQSGAKRFDPAPTTDVWRLLV